METLAELKESVEKVILAANNVEHEFYAYANNQAPIIIHQRFCGELVGICTKEENENKTPLQIPEAMKVLNAIGVLEELYPKLKEKS